MGAGGNVTGVTRFFISNEPGATLFAMNLTELLSSVDSEIACHQQGRALLTGCRTPRMSLRPQGRSTTP